MANEAIEALLESHDADEELIAELRPVIDALVKETVLAERSSLFDKLLNNAGNMMEMEIKSGERSARLARGMYASIYVLAELEWDWPTPGEWEDYFREALGMEPGVTRAHSAR